MEIYSKRIVNKIKKDRKRKERAYSTVTTPSEDHHRIREVFFDSEINDESTRRKLRCVWMLGK